MVICVHSLSVSDSVVMHALCICAVQSVDAAGCVALHAFYINMQTLEDKPAIVPFKATLQFDFKCWFLDIILRHTCASVI